MKTSANILIAVLLTSLVYFTSSQPNRYWPRFPFAWPQHQHSFRHAHPYDIINPFLYKLENALNTISGSRLLNITLKDRVIQDLGQTSVEFKKLCIGYDSNSESIVGEDPPPISALKKSIKYLFDRYKKSAKDQKHILQEIEEVDPIGLNVYLTKKNVEDSSPRFMETVMEFQPVMYARVHLLNMRDDNSLITIFRENYDRTLHEVPKHVREQITTEYGPIKTDTVNLFTDIVTKQLGKKMYRMNTADNIEYKEHTSKDLDDIQIFYGEPLGPDMPGHAICTYYKAFGDKVYAYDSSMRCDLDEQQQISIITLYPYATVEFKRPTVLQKMGRTCGLFAIAYATMLLNGEDPSIAPVKINEIHGDETLYIRIHLLNMLVNQKFAALE